MIDRPRWSGAHFLLPLLLTTALVITACGSPAYWQGVAEGMAATNSGGYAQTEGESGKRQKVCAKYKTRSGWSDGYNVTAVMTDGATLNEKTGTYNYDSYSDYAVIFWDEDEASVLKLQSVSGGVSSVRTRATDQEGRPWKLSTSSLCY